jgi:spermidine/putrescine transport system ATP-binding protein
LRGYQVTIKDISKHFGDFQALKNVSLDIKKGEFFSLLGPSGCGKTTLLRILAGFEEPSAGDVMLDEASVLSLPSNKRHVNTVFQSYALFPHLTVFENVAFPLRIKKVNKNAVTEKVMEYLSLVKLEEHRSKFPNQLSGGQKQRVAIARALINEPGVLLLDEPLSALDAKLRQHMLLELDAIHDKIGITFIYVTHDQQEAISVSDRVAVMNEGEVLQVGTPMEIYENPADIFIARFIGETNIIDGTVTAIRGELLEVAVGSVGSMLVTSDTRLKQGKALKITVRPEKIWISKEKGSHPEDGTNCFKV